MIADKETPNAGGSEGREGEATEPKHSADSSGTTNGSEERVNPNDGLLIVFSDGANCHQVDAARGHQFIPERKLPLKKFGQLFKQHVMGEDKDGQCFGRPMGENGYRENANALPWRLLVLDFDGIRPHEVDDFLAMVRDKWGECIVYTTHSHMMPDKETGEVFARLRAVLICDRDIGHDEQVVLFKLFQAKAPNIEFDLCMKRPAQVAYMPRCPAEREKYAQSWAFSGPLLPVNELLAEAEQRGIIADEKHYSSDGIGTGCRHPDEWGYYWNHHALQHFTDFLTSGAGYKAHRGRRFEHPHSTSGRAGLHIWDSDNGLLWSHNSNDPLAGNGADKKPCYDLVGAYARLKFNDDFGAAAKAIRQWCEDEGWEPHEEEGDLLLGSPPPEPMRDEAFIGVAGDFVNLILPNSEASREALLVQFLAAAGVAVGREVRVEVEADRHGCNENIICVGRTGREGRKGTSGSYVIRVLQEADPSMFKTPSRILPSLSTTEGLIHRVRDRRMELVPDKTTGVIEEKLIDVGVDDKRLLIYTGEYSGILAACARQGAGASLAAARKVAWDGAPLVNASRNEGKGGDEATRHHIGMIAHITVAELRDRVTNVEMVNGGVNRDIYIYVKRSKQLPHGGKPPQDNDPAWLDVIKRLADAINDPNAPGFPRRRTADADVEWEKLYNDYSNMGLGGLMEAILGRVEAHALRLSMIYAMLDQSMEIRKEHVIAARAVMDYAIESTKHIFGGARNTATNADEAKVLHALRTDPTRGLSLGDISRLFQKHRTKEQIAATVANLRDVGLIKVTQVKTKGAPRTEVRLAN